MTYEEFLKSNLKYSAGTKCFMCHADGVDREGRYEGGDARFYCPVCEEHSPLKMRYESEDWAHKELLVNEKIDMDKAVAAWNKQIKTPSTQKHQSHYAKNMLDTFNSVFKEET